MPLLCLVVPPTWAATPPVSSSQPNNQQLCPTPVLSRLTRHRIARRETLASIARQYNLIPATLTAMNPVLRDGNVPVGEEILIPPYNGIRIEVPSGTTWKDIATAYGVRADVLFEMNGCQRQPKKVVFVPGVNWASNNSGGSSNSGSRNREISGYPLPSAATVGLDYGSQMHPVTFAITFHIGIDLLAAPGTNVLAAGDGTVAFAGDRENFGNLIVINHQGGKQTRYAHLATMTVTAGQTIKQGNQIGTVGTTGKPDIDQPHLHFEVRYNSNLGWVAEDPNPYLRQVTSANK